VMDLLISALVVYYVTVGFQIEFVDAKDDGIDEELIPIPNW